MIRWFLSRRSYYPILSVYLISLICCLNREWWRGPWNVKGVRVTSTVEMRDIRQKMSVPGTSVPGTAQARLATIDNDISKPDHKSQYEMQKCQYFGDSDFLSDVPEYRNTLNKSGGTTTRNPELPTLNRAARFFICAQKSTFSFQVNSKPVTNLTLHSSTHQQYFKRLKILRSKHTSLFQT